MKKILLLSLLTLCLFAGCDNTNNPQQSNTSSINTLIPNGEKYSIQILLPNGNNAPSNIDVQWCSSVCKPAKTNENGKAELYLEDDEYEIHLYNLPQGYTYQPGKYFANADDREITITLTQISTPTSGTGLSNDPFLVTEGVYSSTVSNAEQINYYSFKPTKQGKYLIESWIDSTERIDTTFSYYGTSISTPLETVNKEDNNNFSYTLNIDNAEQTHIFGLSADVKREKTFNYSISFVE